MNQRNLFVKMSIDAWQFQLKATNGTFDKIPDLMREIAPGRNRGIYLLGHLTAVHDMMLPLLRFREPLFPELKPVFIDNPDKAVAELPSLTDLRAQWDAVNEELSNYVGALSPEDWFTRHSNVSEEDFLKEPHRNRLNVLLSRTSHLASHRGQLILLTAAV